MELYVPDSTVFIVKFWQKFMHQLVKLVASNNTEENVSLTEKNVSFTENVSLTEENVSFTEKVSLTENVSLTEESVSLTEENVSLTDCSTK